MSAIKALNGYIILTGTPSVIVSEGVGKAVDGNTKLGICRGDTVVFYPTVDALEFSVNDVSYVAIPQDILVAVISQS